MLRSLMILIALATAGFAAGFVVFAERTAIDPPTTAPPSGDAIVALTGGDHRIATAARLLAEGRGARLLVSGVHPDATPDEIKALTGLDDQTFACCVDLGRRARTTTGNAAEIARWSVERDYRRLVIVTADFHMPRALLEIRRDVGADVELVPWVVGSGKGAWRRDLGMARRFSVEYAKLALIWTREAIRAGGLPPDPGQAPAAADGAASGRSGSSGAA